jgi:glucose-1-phosphate adenylyltransferase
MISSRKLFSTHQRAAAYTTATETIALILAGGSGSRLKCLTQWHAKPAVPFGGKYRTIDFSLSNCINSNIRRIGILTQYKSHSLNIHIQNGWNFLRPELGEFISLMPAQQRIESSWYKGTADAIYQNIDILRSHLASYVVILAGDHVYKMDYSLMIQDHIQRGADVTVGCIEVPVEQAKGFGVMSVNEMNRVTRFIEKPQHPETIAGKPLFSMASMGIYVFNTDFLCQLLQEDALNQDSSHDFGKDIIPLCVAKHRIHAYPYRDEIHTGKAYWRDVGTVDSYYQANMDLMDISPELDLYDKRWPIWTYQEQLPPAKFVFNDEGRRGMAVDSMVSHGCIVSGSQVARSLLSSNVRIHSYSDIEDCILLPGVEIGRHCKLKNVIIDKGCHLPPNTVIGYNRHQDNERYHVSENGITLVSAHMLGQEVYHVA